jgi:hypothetical protein
MAMLVFLSLFSIEKTRIIINNANVAKYNPIEVIRLPVILVIPSLLPSKPEKTESAESIPPNGESASLRSDKMFPMLISID